MNREDQKKNLLTEFEPILFFAPEERFFPMDVNRYIESCQLMPISDTFRSRFRDKLSFLWRQSPTVDCSKVDCLRDKDEKHYLHYVHERKWQSVIERTIVLICLLILLGVIWYSVQPRQFGFLKQLESWWPQFWRVGVDDLRMLIPSVFILWSAYKQTNRIVTIALTQCIIIILFFGTPAGTAFSIFAGIFALDYLCLIFFFSIRRKLISNLNKGWRLFINLLGLALYILVILGLDSLLIKLTDMQYGFEREVRLTTFSFIDSYSDLLMTSMLWSIIMILIFLPGVSWIIDQCLMKCKSLSKSNRYLELLNARTYRQHRVSIILLITGTILVGLIFCWVYDNNNLKGFDKIVTYGLIIITGAMIIFSYFVTPHTLYERAIETADKLPETGENQPHYGRMVSIFLIWLIIYWITSFIFALDYIEIGISELPNTFDIDHVRIDIRNISERGRERIRDFIIYSYPFLIKQFFFSIVYVAITLSFAFITIGVLGASAASYFLDILSFQPDTVALKAKFKYRKDWNGYHYYGRVIAEGQWVVLQYHYFYAFNDWRSAQEGLNQHEGDWECVNIYLKVKRGAQNDYKSKNYNKIGVACSQHHNGEFRFWKKDKLAKHIRHPCIYVAKGSHANFFEPKEYKSSELVSGILESIMSQVDRIVRKFRGQKYGLPTEYTSEDGCSIGSANNTWELNLIMGNEGWVEYKGLWGKKEKHPDESGPTGPKWDRYNKNKDKQLERLRWGKERGGLEWMETLLFEQALDESLPVEKRNRALQSLAEL